MKVKEIIVMDYEEIMDELREVLAQMSAWCILSEDYLPV